MSKSILVTGGCGMIGSNLVKRLVKEGYDTYVVDNLWRGKVEYLNDENGEPAIDLNTHFYKKDLSIYEEAKEIVGKTDYIIHLADIVAGIDYIFKNQGEIFRINNLINSNVFTCCREAGKEKIKGIIYAGTVCSFPYTKQNSLNPDALVESDLFPALPESAYGWSKLIGQLEIDYLEKETNIPCCTLMLHNVYGTPTDFGEKAQVIPALMRKAINFPNEEYNVWGSGQQSRAFIHVSDIIEAFILALDKGWGHGYIQIGPDYCTTIKEIAEKIVNISNKDIQPFYDISKPEGDKARFADYSKAKNILGWSPKISLEESLLESYNWIKNEIEK